MLDTRDGHTQMLKSRTIKDAMMLIIYLTGQRLQVDWGAALTGAGLPQLALPSAHLHPHAPQAGNGPDASSFHAPYHAGGPEGSGATQALAA